MLCALFTIFAVAVVIGGFVLIAIGILVPVIWGIVLIVLLVGSGGPAGAAYASVSWWVPFVGFGISVLGFIIVSIGYLLLWIGSLLCTPRSSSSGMAGLLGGTSGAFALPGLAPPPSFPGLPGIDLGGLFGAGSGLLGLLFLPLEQRMKLPPDLLRLVECLRGCLCTSLCGGTHGSLPSDPGQVIVDAGKTLLEDLKAQLDEARRKLEDATRAGNLTDMAYWQNKIPELMDRIRSLGG